MHVKECEDRLYREGFQELYSLPSYDQQLQCFRDAFNYVKHDEGLLLHLDGEQISSDRHSPRCPTVMQVKQGFCYFNLKLHKRDFDGNPSNVDIFKQKGDVVIGALKLTEEVGLDMFFWSLVGLRSQGKLLPKWVANPPVYLMHLTSVVSEDLAWDRKHNNDPVEYSKEVKKELEANNHFVLSQLIARKFNPFTQLVPPAFDTVGNTH
jgi:hypothetical protein